MNEMVPGAPASMGLGERLLTRSQLAYFFGVDRGTVRRWTRAGKLQKVDFKDSRLVRYRPEDVAAFMARGAR